MSASPSITSANTQVKARARDRYEATPDHVKEDIASAIAWALMTLSMKEGSGHIFNLSHEPHGIVCSFAKPSWPGDHCGSPMRTGEEAIVMSVCEYLSWPTHDR